MTIGRIVRQYDDGDWFFEGKVVKLDPVEETADVDFGDWVQRYFQRDLRDCWPEDGSYVQVLIPFSEGIIVADYRSAA